MIRKPSISKSIAARTTGRAKRSFKRLGNPFYGKSGIGCLKNPANAARGKIYRKSTVSTKGLTGCLTACIYYPLYWTFMLMFWVLKLCFIAVIFLLIAIINLLIWLSELIYNGIAYIVYTKRQQAEANTIKQ